MKTNVILPDGTKRRMYYYELGEFCQEESQKIPVKSRLTSQDYTYLKGYEKFITLLKNGYQLENPFFYPRSRICFKNGTIHHVSSKQKPINLPLMKVIGSDSSLQLNSKSHVTLGLIDPSGVLLSGPDSELEHGLLASPIVNHLLMNDRVLCQDFYDYCSSIEPRNEMVPLDLSTYLITKLGYAEIYTITSDSSILLALDDPDPKKEQYSNMNQGQKLVLQTLLQQHYKLDQVDPLCPSDQQKILTLQKRMQPYLGNLEKRFYL